MDTLARDLLPELECPVCMEYMIPPFFMCENGHNICNSCKPKLDKCPTCLGSLTNTKNIALQNLASKLRLQCRFHSSGCKEILYLISHAEHSLVCPHQSFRCPFIGREGQLCSWEGKLEYMKSHLKSAHVEPLMVCEVTGQVFIKVTKCEKNGVWRRVILTLGEVFLWTCKFSRNYLYSCVQYVGPTVKAKNYKYRIKICTLDRSGSATACHMTSQYNEDIDKIFWKANCAAFNCHFVKLCLDEAKSLSVDVEIFSVT